MSIQSFDQTLDTSGLCCPMPMVKTNKAIKAMEAGDVLRIVATDPATQQDIPSWCERNGHELVEAGREDDKYVYMVKKRN